jgi:hypothetical protein
MAESKMSKMHIPKRGQPIFLFLVHALKKIKDYVPLGWLGHSVTLFKEASGIYVEIRRRRAF